MAPRRTTTPRHVTRPTNRRRAGGVTSQPIARLIRREFELLRAAPSAELTTSQS